jgi:hypothetical protein
MGLYAIYNTSGFGKPAAHPVVVIEYLPIGGYPKKGIMPFDQLGCQAEISFDISCYPGSQIIITSFDTVGYPDVYRFLLIVHH